MKQNVGNVDKTIRIILAIVIAALGIYFKSWWGLVALVPLATALMSFCPLYPLFKISTRK
jgi:predicted RND superfamily exporter protein